MTITFYFALAFALAALVYSGIRSRTSDVRVASWLTIAFGGASYVLIGIALLSPHYSPLRKLLQVRKPGAGISGPNGEPPLQIKELVEPISITRAGYYWVIGGDYVDSQILYAALQDSAGTEVEICLAPVKEETSSKTAPHCKRHLYVGGTHPSQPSARLPLSVEEVQTIVNWLKSASAATQLDDVPLIKVYPGSNYPYDLFTLRDKELEKPVEERLHEGYWRHQFVAEILRRASACQFQPMAGEVDVVQRSSFPESANLDLLANKFRSRKANDRVFEWNKLDARLAFELRHNSLPDLKQWLTELLGSPSEVIPDVHRGDTFNYRWEEPAPSELDTLAFQLRQYNDVAGLRTEYAVINLLDSKTAPIRRVTISSSKNNSPHSTKANTGGVTVGSDSHQSSTESISSSLRKVSASFREKVGKERWKEGEVLQGQLSRYLAQHQPKECRSQIISLLGEADSNPPDVLRNHVKAMQPPGKVIFYRVSNNDYTSGYLIFVFDKVGRASSTIVRLQSESEKSATADN